jgi:hypothetical protein
MIHIGIAGKENDIKLIPAAELALFFCCWKKVGEQ